MGRKFEKIITYIPPHNLLRLMGPIEGSKRERTRLNIAGHIAYAIIGGLLLWGVGGVGGSIKLANTYVNWAYKDEINKSEILKERLFGENGLADSNGNGKPDLREVAELYERIGLEDKVMEKGKFPKLSNEDLERAIQSYEAER
jgi:hypothetical protein